MLLDDIRTLYSNRSTDRLTSAEIVEVLGKREDRPWSEWRGDKPITTRQLARLLEPFGVRPTTIRTAHGTAKGYHQEDFADAFRRYPASPSVTPSQARQTAASREVPSVTATDPCYGSNAPGVAENGDCYGVTERSPESDSKEEDGSATDDSMQAVFDERAGIIEYDGGLPREEAEAGAASEVGSLRSMVSSRP